MILILSDSRDGHVEFLIERLPKKGAECFIVDPANFPSVSTTITVARNGKAIERVLRQGKSFIDLESIRSVWWRRPGMPGLAGANRANSEAEANKSELATEAMAGLWEGLNCLWVPAKPSVLRVSSNKVWQLGLARQAGFDMPRTLITNDPNRVIEFLGNNPCGVITKPLSNKLWLDGRAVFRMTERIYRRELRRLRSIINEPMIFQEYVPKAAEIRVTVVGGKIFSSSFEPQFAHRSIVDWRVVHPRGRFVPIRLPEDIEKSCIRLVSDIGLNYGAIDMIRTPSGRYVFLELNPGGQWGYMPGTSAQIARALAQLLVRG